MNFTEKKLQRIFEGDRNIENVKKRKKTIQEVDVKICDDYSAPVEITSAPLIKEVDGKKVSVPQTFQTTVEKGDALASNDGGKTTYILKKATMDQYFTEVEEKPKEKTLSQMNKAELLAVAKLKGIVFNDKMSNKELAKAIREFVPPEDKPEDKK